MEWGSNGFCQHGDLICEEKIKCRGSKGIGRLMEIETE